ncbi:Ig-like domain-containing protein [Shewanella japonica]|uniref:BIG2 domain-containing protein n=1 Tax=Shewanella japonica TaxID=93973 RepID=A0ABN4YD94_9GAMM|nr:Ig-like domain-containing protein [Shewanella japonica]ARD20865.1 hypothetical protein SJ2017_0527 [Shewanella japonica]
MLLKKLLTLLCLSSCLLLSSCYLDNDSDQEFVSLRIYIDSMEGDVSTNEIPKGFSRTAVAILSFANGKSVNVSELVTWHNSAQDILQIVDNKITGLNTGSTSIHASYNKLISHDILIEVTPAVSTSIQLTPASTSLPIGLSQSFQAIATFSDLSMLNITNDVNWNLSDDSIANIDKGELTTLQTGNTEINVSFENLTSNTVQLEVTDALLESIQITPSVISIARGLHTTYVATGTYTDNSTQDLTSLVSWSSTNNDIVTISDGIATSINKGNTIIIANFNGISSNSASLTVTDAELVNIQVTPATLSLAKGTISNYVAKGTYTDSSTQDITDSVSWSSTDTDIATIINGSAMTFAVGSTTITAKLNEISSNDAALTVTDAELVSIQITPATISLAKGTSTSYVATGTYTDNTTQDITTSVAWSSSDTDLATIISGSATAVKEGIASISASLNGISSNSASLTVTAEELVSIQITPATISLAKGTSTSYVATGTYTDNTTQDITTSVAWSSSDTDLATIISGSATAVKEGIASISASLNGISSNSASLTVTAEELVSIQITPATISLAKGTSTSYVATGTYTDNTTQDITTSVAWSSSDTDLATIISGSATAVKEGIVSISASLNSISSNSASLTVTTEELVSIQITPATISLAKGTSTSYVATGTYTDNTTQDITTSVAWSSSDTNVATILSGVAITVNEGIVSISASLNSISSNSASLTVTTEELVSIQITPATISLAKGTSTSYVATGTYTDNTTQDITPSVAWSSSDTNVATILSGVATTISEGMTSISVNLSGINSNVASLTVTSEELVSIQITPAITSLAKGINTDYVATGTYSDNSTLDITALVSWSSSDTNVATILSGLATTVNEGIVSISASLNGINSNSATLTVTAEELASIQITPAIISLAKGINTDYVAMGTYTDNSTLDITASVSWNSSDTNVATILNGSTTTINMGITTINASLNGINSNSATLTVTAEELVSIQITPATISLAKGINTDYVAIGTYTDNTTQNITNSVAWSSSDTNVATILDGSATAVNEGIASISARLNSISSNSASLTVTTEELVSIQITPATISLAKGINTDYVATGTYTDNSTLDITASVSWNSSDINVATILDGSATTVNVGMTDISASSNSITSSLASLTVTPAELISVQLSPTSVSLAKGLNTSFVATGTYTDNSTQNLTSSVSWNSSDTSVATILSGSAATLAEGNTTISASLSGFSINTANLLVTPAALQSIQITSLTNTLLVGRSTIYTAEGTYTDGTSLDINSTVSWSSSDTSLVTILSGTATAVSSGLAQITASQNGISSNENLSLVNEVSVCGADLAAAAGVCIKTLIGLTSDAKDKEFTNTPSLAVLNSMGYTKMSGASNTGTTYSRTFEGTGTFDPVGTFILMQQFGDSTSQHTRYCNDLNTVSFNSKTNWRQATSDELRALYFDYPNSTLYTTHGWAINKGYWSSTPYNISQFILVAMHSGSIFSSDPVGHRSVSCVSEL